MPLIVKNTGTNTIIHNNDYVADDFNSPQLIENTRQLHLPFADATMSHWYFDGIRMGHSTWNYKSYETVEWQGALDVVSLHFNVKGKVSLTMTNFDQPFVLGSGQHNMFYASNFTGVIRNEELHQETFMIQLTKKAFLRLAEDAGDNIKQFACSVMEGKPVMLCHTPMYMNVAMHHAIRQLVNCPYTGGLKKMFLLSKCMEIMVLQADAHSRATNRTIVYAKSDYDKERIVFARDYLLQHLDVPPTLTELARIAGINEFKLKRGFKELFGDTVFGYLSEHRLELAKKDILLGKKPATEIAFELGYSSLQHFSNAFKKKFGVSPRQVR